ncbi:MAG TPA: hypothetical protein VFT55_08015 [Planctomycetota bacterium]|nr:hypothetical protein [Planctomycetota bacterium]
MKPLLLVPAIAAVGLACLLAAGNGDIAPPVTIGSPQAAPAPDEVAAIDTRRGDESVREASDEAPSAAPPIDVDAIWYDVLVVDGETQQPVAGAAVAWFGEDATDLARWAHEDEEQVWRRKRDDDDVAARYGWRTASDGRGVARVGGNAWLQVIATHGDRYGTLYVAENTVVPRGGYRLELYREVPLEVVAIDDAGVPVASLVVRLQSSCEDGRWSDWEDIPTALTDERGQALLRHTQTCALAKPQPTKWRVAAAYPGNNDGAPFDPQCVPLEPLVLRTPRFGSVRACVEVAGVGVVRFAPDEWSLASLERGPASRPNLALESGWVEFSHLPLAESWRLRGPRRSEAECDGPRRAGEVVEIRLADPGTWTRFHGRLVDALGAPVAAKLRAWCSDSEGNATPFATDPEGRFSVLVVRRSDEPVALSIGRHASDCWLWARWRGPVPPRGVMDVGTLVMREDPLVVAGCFVQCGRPVARHPQFAVELQRRNDEGDLVWVEADDVIDDVAADGTFEVRGNPGTGRLRLSFEDPSFLSIPPVEFERGTRGLAVEVDAGHPLAASVLAPEVMKKELVAELIPRTAGSASSTREAEDMANGCMHLRWSALAAGVYTLRLRMFAFPEPLVEIPDVLVPPPTGGDPRLVDIDLNPLVRTVALSLFDGSGDALRTSDAFVSAGHRGSGGELLGLKPDGDELLLPRGTTRLLVMIDWHRPQTVSCAADALALRFEPWPTVACVLDAPPGMLDGLFVQLLALPLSETGRFVTATSDGDLADLARAKYWTSLQGSEPAELQMADGAHELVLEIARHRSDQELITCAPRPVFAGAGSIRVTPEPVALRAALERLRAAGERRR